MDALLGRGSSYSSPSRVIGEVSCKAGTKSTATVSEYFLTVYIWIDIGESRRAKQPSELSYRPVEGMVTDTGIESQSVSYFGSSGGSSGSAPEPPVD